MDIDKTIEENMGLVYMHLHKFRRANDDDAYSYALEGLWKAAETYNGDVSAFSTYASVCIYNAICYYLRKVKREASRPVVSYDAPVDDSENGIDFQYFLADDRDPEKIYMENDLMKKTDETIRRMLDSMRESTKKRVIQTWYDSGCTIKQTELGEICGTSQSHASRTINEFRYKLKKEMEGYF